MRLFGNKEENIEKERFNGEGLNRTVSSRSIKDLKPENKRNRKEPPKPWGKKERVLVSSILLATILCSAVLAVSAREWKLPGLPRLSLSSLNLNLFEEETIVIGDVTTAGKKNLETISLFNSITRNLSGIYSFYIVDLAEGNRYGVGESEVMQAASLVKLPVMIALYKEAEAGRINLDSTYTLKNSDKIGGSGSLAGKPVGTVLTYRELGRLMGKQSDNTAFGIVRRRIGEEKIRLVMDEIGMTRTDLPKNQTTPYEVGLLFEKLWKNELVSDANRNEILESLTDTIYESHLKAGIADVRVAHKYGREIHVVNDAGIIYGQKPFVLVIMTQGVVEKEADAIFPELAKLLYAQQIGN